MNVEIKDTNPKDAIGMTKATLSLFPDTAVAAGAMAFFEGALKYSPFNWRTAGVRISVYMDALKRHAAAYWNGEDIDPESGLPHSWKMLACCAILVDAAQAGKLNDDRPPPVDMARMYALCREEMADLRNRLAPSKAKERVRRVYVAGRFQSYEKVREMIDTLQAHGYEVTHDWTRTPEFGADGHPLHPVGHGSREALRAYAEDDKRGVQTADFLVLLADDSLAGAWWEAGMAHAYGIPIFVVSPERWTIFLECDGVCQTTYDDLLNVIPPVIVS